MSSIAFNVYLKSIQKNLPKGSERSHYPTIKSLLDKADEDIDAVIEEKRNKAGILDFTVKRKESCTPLSSSSHRVLLPSL